MDNLEQNSKRYLLLREAFVGANGEGDAEIEQMLRDVHPHPKTAEEFDGVIDTVLIRLGR